jgi:uncharacterized protein (DUF2267 family)
MQYDEFINKVQERARLETRDEAVQLTEITLAALAEPLSREETNRLASQLPGELKRLLEKHHEEPLPARQTMQSFHIEEYYNRVKGRLGVSYRQGVEQANAVMSVLLEAVPNTIISSMLQDLPDGYDQVFR